MKVSCCGLVCDECGSYKKECEGCWETNGKPQWVQSLELRACPFYLCCKIEKELNSCGQCNKMPCEKFSDIRDPSISDVEFNSELENRIKRLKNVE